MKAIIQSDDKSPNTLELEDGDSPTGKPGEVLMRVCASSLNAGYVFSVKGSPWLVRLTVGFPKPKDAILRHNVAGRVEAFGADVTGAYRPRNVLRCQARGKVVLTVAEDSAGEG